MDSSAGGGVTVSTGVAPVEHQPNINVTQSSSSYSTSAPDADTKVNKISVDSLQTFYFS